MCLFDVDISHKKKYSPGKVIRVTAGQITRPSRCHKEIHYYISLRGGIYDNFNVLPIRSGSFIYEIINAMR